LVIYLLQLHENDTSIDKFEASEENVQEDNADQAQTTASPLDQPDSNAGTVMESAVLEKTNGDIDVKAVLDEASLTSFVEEEGAVINQTDNGSENVPVVEQTLAEVHIRAEISKDEENKFHLFFLLFFPLFCFVCYFVFQSPSFLDNREMEFQFNLPLSYPFVIFPAENQVNQ
jgi:hypothetical protein